MRRAERQVVVVGSGIAGLIAALELSRGYHVTLVTKALLADSNTRWAQGGIAAAVFADDSAASHIEDTLAAGAGLCDPEAVRVLCSEGPERIRDLIRLGVRFDRTASGELARGLEAAHSMPRVLHAGGDATGLSIETALVHAVRAARNIQVLENTFALDLVVKDGAAAGLEVLDARGGRRILEAEAVVLASGGAGEMYLHTTNPSVATGDGLAMALRAGAQLADVEFYQFHPTALAAMEKAPLDESGAAGRGGAAAAAEAGAARPAPFLISEAVRGEGAVLLDIHGQRFMEKVHPAAELAPRDVVARGIARQMARQGGAPVLLDVRGLRPREELAEFLARRFPSIDAETRARGLDWSREPIPVTPAAHYWMGGVRTDVYGRTSIPGLYAVGEVACTGVHGANRLASNSLLESLTFAWRCAHLLLSEEAAGMAASAGKRPETFLAEASLPAANREAEPEVKRAAGEGEPVSRRELQRLMWAKAGIERSREGLQEAARRLSGWHGVDAGAKDARLEELETRNLLELARVVVAAALAREESRGAHFRSDFPTPRPEWRRSLVYRAPAQSLRQSGMQQAQAGAAAGRKAPGETVPC
ncbi:MAG: L-aspartate oxidase [Acidobacteriota bacterium]